MANVRAVKRQDRRSDKPEIQKVERIFLSSYGSGVLEQYDG